MFAASPRPKCCCHSRFTNTRAVSGLLGEAIQFASAVRRPVDCNAASGGTIRAGVGSRMLGNPGAMSAVVFGMRVGGAVGPASLTMNLATGNGFGFSAACFFNSARSFSHSALVSPFNRSGSFDCSKSNCRWAISAIWRSYAVRSDGRLRTITLISSTNFSNPSRVACLSKTGCSISCSRRRKSSVFASQFASAFACAACSGMVPMPIVWRGNRGAKNARSRK